jgi:putative transposase
MRDQGRARDPVTPRSREYQWSNYSFNARGASGPNADWIRPHEEYRRLGRTAADRQAAYRPLFGGAIAGADLSEIRECAHKGWALGGERFRERIEAMGQRRAASKGVGSPRKEDNRV